jgi:RNA polymerase sigma-70 factor, ECF subfamily
MTSQPHASLDALMERLFLQYQRPIVNYVYRMLGDDEQAQEVAQDVFVRACAALDRLPGDANHRAWLYRIATNAACDVLRRRRLLSWVALRETDGDTHACDPLEGMEDQQVIQAVLLRIPASYRAVLILFSVQGYSVREISEMLSISEGAVKTRLSRARERFRKAYGHED